MAQLDLSVSEVLGASAAIPLGLVGTEIAAETAPEINFLGVRLFGGSVLDETLGRLLIGASILTLFSVADASGSIPEGTAAGTDISGLIEGITWGLALGASSSAFMELYTFFIGPFQFQQPAEMFPDRPEENSPRRPQAAATLGGEA